MPNLHVSQTYIDSITIISQHLHRRITDGEKDLKPELELCSIMQSQEFTIFSLELVEEISKEFCNDDRPILHLIYHLTHLELETIRTAKQISETINKEAD